MIIRIFKNTSSAIGAVNYVLSEKDYTGKIRSVEPKILSGNPELTKQIDIYSCSNFQHKSVSGVIAFADNEDITEKQKQELIDDFEKAFFGNAKDRVNALYVEHRDKGNLEIHFVINRVIETEKGAKSFNPFPPGKMTMDFKDCFCSLKNDVYGFNQIVENPLKTKFNVEEIKAISLNRHSFKNLYDKIKIDKAIQDIVKNKIVKNKAELVKYLKDEIGLNVHRNGDDYISIKTDNGKNIRLKGGIYSNHDNKNYSDVRIEYKEEKQKTFNKEETEKKFNRILEARNNYNSKRYQLDKSSEAPKFKSNSNDISRKAIQPSTAPKATTDTQTHQEPEKTAPSGSNDLPGVPGTVASSGSMAANEPRTNDSMLIADGGGSSASVGVAQEGLDKANGAYALAKTPAEKARALRAIATARTAYDNAVIADSKSRERKIKI